MNEFDVFEKPSLDAKIWRYMDFATFVSVLSKSSLHFTRIDLLDDPFEGSIPKSSYSKKPVVEYKTLFKEMELDPNKELKEIRNGQKTIEKAYSRMVKAERKMTFVNSWCVDPNESVAMWKLYGKNLQGIVFQSTFKELTESFINKDEVHFGLVHYVDYNQTKTDGLFDEKYFWHLSHPYMFKRTSFQYEKELRAIIKTEPGTAKAKKQYWSKNGVRGIPTGYDAEIDISTLIKRIYVSPNAGKWFEELVESLIKKFEYTIKVDPSSLTEEPTF